MRLFQTTAALALGVSLATSGIAQQNNQGTRKASKAELKQQEKADKAQAKADKSERKALNSKQVKKAAKDQDKANAAQPH